MNPPRPATETADRIATLRVAFVDQLPMQLHAVGRLFEEFASSSWNKDVLERMLTQTRDLSGSALTFGLRQVGEAARELEQALQVELASTSHIDSRRGGELASVLKRLLATPLPDPERLLPLAAAPRGQGQAMAAAEFVDIVDADAASAQRLAEQVGYFGYAVRCHHTLEAFASAFRTQAPLAVVMSLEFPDTSESSATLMGRLMHETGRSVPVAFLSTSNDIQARLRTARAGSSRFLLKPVAASEIIEAIGSLVNGASTEPYRVLLVDDSAAIAQLYAGILEGAGLQVALTTNPLKALDILAEFRPDIAIIDLYMPECSGQELAAVIRQDDTYVSLPIVFLSAETDRKRQLTALQLGADDFLTKPIQPEHLIAAVTSRAARARQLRGLLDRDSLTGVLNHSTFVEAASKELSRSRRNGRHCTVALLDLDQFKQLNENHGHPAGDRVLRNLARQLRQRLRSVDTVGRYGGEEFGVVLAGTDGHSALAVLDGIREDFARITHSGPQGSFMTSFSCGLADFPEFTELPRLIEAADSALIKAKATGRNRSVLRTPENL